MCCLFGLIDVKHTLSPREKNRILSILGTTCEARGTDATGYSYTSKGKLHIYKKAVPAHQLSFNIPRNAHCIMGHTRMTTQGAATKIQNNHPFPGHLPGCHFSLAHNGVLSNDHTLRILEKLPCTNVETDSYVAVQLIEKNKTLDFSSLRKMAETVQGTFTFTILDQRNNLYIVKGNNPLCLYQFKEGFFLYASTQAILDAALDAMGYERKLHEQIEIDDGEILKINPSGEITRAYFKAPAPKTFNYYTDYYSFYNYGETWQPVTTPPTGYRKEILRVGEMLGIPSAELEYLHQTGMPDFELEECIYDQQYRTICLYDAGYYDAMEEYPYEYDYFEDRPRAYA